MKTSLLGAVVAIALSGAGSSTQAATLFSDDFNAGASSAWSNTSGNWAASGGVYFAQDPNNFPNSHSFVSTLPSLTDFTVNVDVNAARDGGIWLRAQNNASAVGVEGVLLIFLNDAIHPNTLFWHIVTAGGYGPELNTAFNQPLGDFSIRITAQGDLFSAYLNGSTTAATTLVDDTFASGYTGVYDHDIFNHAESFDNFVVTGTPLPTPLPAALPLFATGLGMLGLLGWHRKRKAISA